MYGLKAAALLAYNQLVTTLQQYGYHPVEGTMGLWKHISRPLHFCLCVDDFGIKYFNKDDLDHFLNSLSTKYKYSVDWLGTNYCGLTLRWNYDKGYVDILMPGYIDSALVRLQYKQLKHPQYSPHQHQSFKYGNKGITQTFQAPDTSHYCLQHRPNGFNQ